MNDQSPRQLAISLREHAAALSRLLYDAARDGACASWQSPQTFDEVQEWGRSQLLTAIDLLAAWFETHDVLFKELFAGWVQTRMVQDLSEEPIPADYRPEALLQLTKTSWLETLEPHLPAEDLAILVRELEEVAALVSKPPLKRPRILFIGDCIQFEIITALSGPCTAAQIRYDYLILNDKVQPVLRNRIRTLRPDQFDLVFFSPFSYRYMPEYEVLLDHRSRFWPAAKLAEHIDSLLSDVCSTVDVLAAQLECPIYIHNTAGVVQSAAGISGLAKNWISQDNRKSAREIINRRMAAYVQDPRFESRVRLIDEDALRERASERALGEIYIHSNAFHPTRMSVQLARRQYFEAVYVSAFLAGKKVVVCDLDNTLWDGIIGEGPVVHFPERQATLKELRRRGVLLSINSKNDPKNVHWDGATLQADDFVAPQINWNPKVGNMAAIRDELNLKLKDFVFLDDRPDELERMKNAYPEIVVLNSTEPTTWELLAHWPKTLPADLGEDRTRQYHERVERERFLNEIPRAAAALEDETEVLKALQLSVKIGEVSKAGLKRAAELVNRTNQFNLNGSRTTVRELEEGLGVTHSVITVEAADKFGSMGVVGVMRVDHKPEGLEIPIFVLSCRAFGFGVEYALLNSVKSLVQDDPPLFGLYRETQHNQPCRKLYPESGLEWDGTRWVGRVSELPADPVWLSIENGVKAKNWPAPQESLAPRR